MERLINFNFDRSKVIMAKNIKITKDPLSIDKRTNSRFSHFLKIQLHKPLVGCRKVDLQCLTKIVSFYGLMQSQICIVRLSHLRHYCQAQKNEITKGPKSTYKMSKLIPSCFIKLLKKSPLIGYGKARLHVRQKQFHFAITNLNFWQSYLRHHSQTK